MKKPVLFVVSYAGIRAVNRAVYTKLQPQVEVFMAVPNKITAASGLEVVLEPRIDGEGELIGHHIYGRNPRLLGFHGLSATLRQVMPDIILYEGDPASRLAWQLARWASAHESRLICQTYDNVDRRWSANKEKAFGARLQSHLVGSVGKLMNKRLYALLVVNRAGEAAFANLGYRRIIRIPLGYSPQVFFADEELRRGTRERLEIQPDEIVIGYFGRMVPQKGVHLLVKALALLQHLKWRFLLDDDFDQNDSYASEVKSMIDQHQLASRVILFKASHSEIADYMRAADVAVAPSLSIPSFTEQYGRAVQETMACRCTVIVSSSGHLPDLVNDTDLVFPDNNLEKLVELLRRALTDAAWRAQKSQQLCVRASSNLTISHQAEAIMELINAVQ